MPLCNLALEVVFCQRLSITLSILLVDLGLMVLPLLGLGDIKSSLSGGKMKSNFSQSQTIAKDLLIAYGLAPHVAESSARQITMADAWGRGSHGLLRLPHYLRRISAGGIDKESKLTTIKDKGPVLSLDGNGGMGHYQASQASALATERAENYGVSVVSVANSNHCGVLGLYVLDMVSRGFIGLAFTNGPAVMPAWGGNKAILSTSPLACGIPAKPRPAIIDLATSTVARGRIAQAAAKEEEIPDGWAFDANGDPTNDAKAALFGMLAPMAGAKGFALALMVEALTGGLVGPSLSNDVADPLSLNDISRPQGLSHLLIAIDPSAFSDDNGASSRLDRMAEQVISTNGRLPGTSRPLPDEVTDTTEVEVADSVASEIIQLAASKGVDLPPTWRG